LLGFGCGKHRLRRSAEDHEEGISLRIDLDAAVALKGAPQQLPMGFQEGREAITRLEQKAWLPSISVNKIVTVPSGSSRITSGSP